MADVCDLYKCTFELEFLFEGRYELLWNDDNTTKHARE